MLSRLQTRANFVLVRVQCALLSSGGRAYTEKGAGYDRRI